MKIGKEDIVFIIPVVSFFVLYFLLSEVFSLFDIKTWIDFDEPMTMFGGGGRTSYEYESDGEYTYYGAYSIIVSFMVSRKMYIWLFNKYTNKKHLSFDNKKWLSWILGLTSVIIIRLVFDRYIDINYIIENIVFLISAWVILKQVHTHYGWYIP